MKEEAFPVLKKAAAIMNSIPNFVRVEGHTDDTKMSLQGSTTQFETNWELSSARSVNVVRFFSDSSEVDGRKLSAIGFAQYRPIYGNETPEGRAFNRRIDIVILREKGLSEAKSPELKDYKPLPDEEWR